MKSSFKLLLGAAVLIALGVAFVNFFITPANQSTEREAARFREVAAKGSRLLEALREAPDFQSIYFGTCAQIERAGTSGDDSPFVFVPQVGERVKYASVQEALEKNPAMLRDYPACRKVTVVYMEVFPYRGSVTADLDGKGVVLQVSEPVFSN